MKPQTNNTYSQRFREATILRDTGKYLEAFREYNSLVADFPDNPEPLFNCGVCTLRLGYNVEAIGIFLKLIESQPNYAEAHSWLAKAYHFAGNKNKAIEEYKKALDIDNKNLTALIDLGNLYAETWQDDDAVDAYQKALAIKPSIADVHINYAGALARLGNFDLAIKHANKAVRLEPKNHNAYRALSGIYLMYGKTDEAIQKLNKAIEINPRDGFIYHALVTAKKITEKDRHLIDKMESVLNLGMSTEQRKFLLYALGKAYDDLKEPDKAIIYINQANMLVHSDYDHKPQKRNIKIYKKFYSAGFFKKKSKPSDPSKLEQTPIFIVGMPRSGSTLIDQILATHSQVRSIGESPAIYRLIFEIKNESGSDKEFFKRLKNLDVDKYRKKYFEQTGIDGANTTHSIDKNLFNYMNLGIIALLFPNARIIHTRRSPLDTCLSCYLTGFSSSEPVSAWTHNFEYIGKYYRDYMDIMEHWHKVLPIPILDVRYEDVISDTETAARQLVDFCGLEWEQECLDFYKTDRLVYTSSLWQVRQPIYKTAMQRWVPYAKHLQPLILALGDIIEDDYPKIESLGLKHGPGRNSIMGKFTRLFS